MTNGRTIDERYGAATQAPRLVPVESHHDYSGHLELLIAAGYCGADSLGILLYRLRTEWDLAAGEYRLALRLQRAAAIGASVAHRDASRLEREAAKLPDPAALLAQAREIRVFAAAELATWSRAALTAKALALTHLKTLRAAQEALGNFVLARAAREGLSRPAPVLMALSGKALQFWLDSICPTCSGRGFTGGHMHPTVFCSECGHTGRSDFSLRGAEGKGDASSRFVRSIMSAMDLKCHAIDRTILRYIRRGGEAGAIEASEEAALKARLVALRSTEAESD